VTGIGPNSGDAIKVLMLHSCLYDGHGANAIQVKGRLAASTFHLTIYHSIIKDQGQYPYGVIVSTRIMRITHTKLSFIGKMKKSKHLSFVDTTL